MQNKKSLLKRMLVIYITFFAVLVAGIVQNIVPNVSKGYAQGSTIGEAIVKNMMSGTPLQISLLGEVPLNQPIPYAIPESDALSGKKIAAEVRHLNLTVEQPAAPGEGAISIALKVIGGSPWFYLLTMLETLAAIAIIVLMLVIIESIRRSIRREETLRTHNIWCIRTIGILTILSELSHSLMAWQMNHRAAELLAESGIVVETAFTASLSTLIMGILIIFTGEVFAIGQNLSEEQKLTI